MYTIITSISKKQSTFYLYTLNSRFLLNNIILKTLFLFGRLFIEHFSLMSIGRK